MSLAYLILYLFGPVSVESKIKENSVYFSKNIAPKPCAIILLIMLNPEIVYSRKRSICRNYFRNLASYDLYMVAYEDNNIQLVTIVGRRKNGNSDFFLYLNQFIF